VITSTKSECVKLVMPGLELNSDVQHFLSKMSTRNYQNKKQFFPVLSIS